MADEWPRVPLDNVALSTDYVANGSFATLKENVSYRDSPNYAVLVRTVDFNNNWNGDYVWVDQHAYKFLSKSRLNPGDLVMSNVGSVGIVFRVPNLGQPMTLGPNAVMCRTRDAIRLDQRFLYYFFLAPDGQAALRSITSGSVQPKFNKTDLRSLRIPLPPLPEQRAIAHILGTLDDKIELNRRMSETVEAMARALFKSWFVDFNPVRAKMDGRWRKGESLPGLPAHVYDLFPDRLVDSELGEIPEGWEVGTLGNVAEHPRRGVQPEQIAPDSPYIALEHMPKQCVALSEWGTADGLESSKFQFNKGEILFGKLRPYFHKVGVAPVDGVCSTDIVVVAPRSMQWFGFVLGHVSSVAFVEYTNAGSTGTKMPRTSWHDMARYLVALPPKPLAAAFTRLIQPSVDRIVADIHESRTLAAVRDALLPKLICGELRVKNGERFLASAALGLGEEEK
jgi:type I restriction enzyme S subunit